MQLPQLAGLDSTSCLDSRCCGSAIGKRVMGGCETSDIKGLLQSRHCISIEGECMQGMHESLDCMPCSSISALHQKASAV